MKEQLVEVVEGFLEKYSENVSNNKAYVFLSCDKMDYKREERRDQEQDQENQYMSSLISNKA